MKKNIDRMITSTSLKYSQHWEICTTFILSDDNLPKIWKCRIKSIFLQKIQIFTNFTVIDIERIIVGQGCIGQQILSIIYVFLAL